MRVELTFKDGTTIGLSSNSVLEPSGNVYVRNRFYVYAPDGYVPSFVSLFSDEDNLDEMLFIAYADDEDRVLFRHELHHYNIVAQIGRKLLEEVDTSTGEKTSYYRLYAVLEQPTPIERQEPIPDPETEEVLNILLGVEE